MHHKPVVSVNTNFKSVSLTAHHAKQVIKLQVLMQYLSKSACDRRDLLRSLESLFMRVCVHLKYCHYVLPKYSQNHLFPVVSQ